MIQINKKIAAVVLVIIALVAGITVGATTILDADGTTADSTPISGTDEPFRISAFEMNRLPEDANLSRVDPLPEPVREAIEIANPEGTHGDEFRYVAVTRQQFRSSLRPFYGKDLPEMTPRHEVYYIERNETIYEVHFDVLSG
jgi:hypothetical protein